MAKKFACYRRYFSVVVMYESDKNIIIIIYDPAFQRSSSQSSSSGRRGGVGPARRPTFSCSVALDRPAGCHRADPNARARTRPSGETREGAARTDSGQAVGVAVRWGEEGRRCTFEHAKKIKMFVFHKKKKKKRYGRRTRKRPYGCCNTADFIRTYSIPPSPPPHM